MAILQIFTLKAQSFTALMADRCEYITIGGFDLANALMKRLLVGGALLNLC